MDRPLTSLSWNRVGAIADTLVPPIARNGATIVAWSNRLTSSFRARSSTTMTVVTVTIGLATRLICAASATIVASIIFIPLGHATFKRRMPEASHSITKLPLFEAWSETRSM